MRYVLPPLFFIFLAGATFLVKGQREVQPAPVATAAPAGDVALATAADPREQFALDVLRGVGNDAPTPQIVAFLMEWTVAEDGGDGALGRNNPLNTTICGHNAIGSINGDGACGVGHYATYEDGVSATVDTLAQGNFSGITAALQGNDPDAARAALWASPWASSHYGGGTGWPHVDAPAWGEQAPADDTRAQLVTYALSLQGIPYVRGGRSASGGDCSGTMEHVYLQVTGIDIGGTTFNQYPNLAPVDSPEPGDLAYFWQFSDGDEHVGMVADVNGDGVFDLINNGGLAGDMHVDYSFMSMPYFSEHFKGYRRAL